MYKSIVRRSGIGVIARVCRKCHNIQTETTMFKAFLLFSLVRTLFKLLHVQVRLVQIARVEQIVF